jgi:hypothetical protein
MIYMYVRHSLIDKHETIKQKQTLKTCTIKKISRDTKYFL